MLTLEDILKMWTKDCIIDELQLDVAALEGSKLHAKYLEIYSMFKLQHKKKELDFKILLKHKWLYYNGKMSQVQMDSLGWSYDPLDGLKVLKGDMDYYYDSDKHIQEAQARIQYIKEVVDALKEIMDNIKWRHQSIKNAIEWRKFTSGM